jgi:predicted membrane protein
METLQIVISLIIFIVIALIIAFLLMLLAALIVALYDYCTQCKHKEWKLIAVCHNPEDGLYECTKCHTLQKRKLPQEIQNHIYNNKGEEL